MFPRHRCILDCAMRDRNNYFFIDKVYKMSNLIHPDDTSEIKGEHARSILSNSKIIGYSKETKGCYWTGLQHENDYYFQLCDFDDKVWKTNKETVDYYLRD